MLFESDRLQLQCADGVGTLWMRGGSTGRHSATMSFLHELHRAFDAVERRRGIDVLVLRGLGDGVFLSGPDAAEYDALPDTAARLGFAALGQQTFQRLANLSSTLATVAFIDGDCRDAGLELALACDFRLAVSRPETKLGFTSCDSGFTPCWGAATRLPALIGPSAAVELLVDGPTLSARAARNLDLVDHAFGPKQAKTELWWFVADVQDRSLRRRTRSLWSRGRRLEFLSDRRVFRPCLNRLPSDSHLRPVVEAMRRGWKLGAAEGFAAERRAFAEHGFEPAGAWLRSLARQRQARAEYWRDIDVPRRIGIAGCDALGVRLALATLASGGRPTTSLDIKNDRLASEMHRAVERGWFNVVEAEQKLKSVAVAENREAMHDCDLVFLTGPAAAQAAALLDLDEALHADVDLVVTSPVLPFDGLGARLRFPQRVVAAGFDAQPNWPAMVQLAPTRHTADATLGRVFRWLENCGQCVVVQTPTRKTAVTAAA